MRIFTLNYFSWLWKCVYARWQKQKLSFSHFYSYTLPLNKQFQNGQPSINSLPLPYSFLISGRLNQPCSCCAHTITYKLFPGTRFEFWKEMTYHTSFFWSWCLFGFPRNGFESRRSRDVGVCESWGLVFSLKSWCKTLLLRWNRTERSPCLWLLVTCGIFFLNERNNLITIQYIENSDIENIIMQMKTTGYSSHFNSWNWWYKCPIIY